MIPIDAEHEREINRELIPLAGMHRDYTAQYHQLALAIDRLARKLSPLPARLRAGIYAEWLSGYSTARLPSGVIVRTRVHVRHAGGQWHMIGSALAHVHVHHVPGWQRVVLPARAWDALREMRMAGLERGA